MAVEMFFMISGFYMGLILNEKYLGKDFLTFFYENRFLKIFPTYLLILSVTLLVYLAAYYMLNRPIGGLGTYINNKEDLGFLQLCLLFLTNITIIGQDVLMFIGFNKGEVIFTSSFDETSSPGHEFLLIPQSWTLALELYFYLLAPFIARKSVLILLLLFMSFLIMKVGLWDIGMDNDPWSYRFFIAEMVFFVAGLLAYRLYVYVRRIHLTYQRAISVVLVLLFLVHGLFYSYHRDNYVYLNIDILKNITYMLLWLTLPFAFLLSKNYKWDRVIGELSYPVYLVHILIILIVNQVFKVMELEFTNSNYMVGLYVFTSIGVAIVINELFIKKIEHFRILNFKRMRNG